MPPPGGLIPLQQPRQRSRRGHPTRGSDDDVPDLAGADETELLPGEALHLSRGPQGSDLALQPGVLGLQSLQLGLGQADGLLLGEQRAHRQDADCGQGHRDEHDEGQQPCEAPTEVRAANRHRGPP